MRLSVLNGRVIDPASGLDRQADLHVADGRIVAIGAAPAGFHAERTVQADGLVVAPGLVDLSARLREPGYEYKATLESEMAAALAGGITSLACPPDTDPPLDEPGLVEMLKHRARGLDQARLYPLGALTVGLAGEKITEMAELAEAGCVGFSQAGVPILDTQVLLRAMQYARTFDFTVFLRPQDPHLASGGVAHAGVVAARLGLGGIPVIAETVALSTILDLVRDSGCRVHLCRLSSAAGLELVRRAKAEGLPVSADVAVHHLHLIDLDIGYFDSHYRVDPPFRALRDREAIRAALADGTLDAICSDHTPVDDDSKQLPFAEAEAGCTALELLLPLTLKWASETRTALPAALATITCGSSAVLGLGETAGAIRAGASADLCVFDPVQHWTVTRESLLSQGRHTPFLEMELEGRTVFTLVEGRVVHARSSEVDG